MASDRGEEIVGEPRMLIDGRLVESRSGAAFDNVNPATEEVIGSVADASVADVQAAIAAARLAFDESPWADDREFRKHCLEQLQAALESQREEFRAELIAEAGCPISSTFAAQLDTTIAETLPFALRHIDEFGWQRELPGISTANGASWRRVSKVAVGVVGIIVPWNFPFRLTLQKLADALATGNTVIVKPAPETPWSGTHLGRLIVEMTDIPPGVVNVVTSSDSEVAEELVTDPRVDMISFTGSTSTGKRIMERGAPSVKRLLLELGGKSAHIVLEDADFPTVMPQSDGTCFHAGQVCANYSRWLIPRSRYEEAVDLMAATFESVKFGDPLDPVNIQGPQISEKQRDRVLSYIETGRQEGAVLVVGGNRPPALSKGWYVEPTLFSHVENSMTIAREEIFGPVLVAIPFDDDADAVRIANDSRYGLVAAVTSGSEARALSVAKQLRVGTVSINGGVYSGPDAPFGGFKESGIGRQNGVEGFESYVETITMAGPA